MLDKSLEAPASAVAVFSGGMDSTVLLYSLLKQGVDIRGALSIDYGQKHRKELICAREICEKAGIEHKVVDLRSITDIFGNSSLTNTTVDVPEGHYEEVTMKSTVVPNRNMILISIATAWGIAKKVEAVAYGAHSGDHAVYPDCREPFAESLDKTIQQCDWHPIRLYRPLVNMSKAEIATLGMETGAPLDLTWSCYKGGDTHCGCCGTCVERREAFYLAGIADPTVYEDSAPNVETLIGQNWKP
ncbi:7-cyano-7-deazaguanine synthase QueC [Puniceicoccaceae bacterium K14]|nr:7-cyano-7-deazaguanine synthase QueC [Puniceicoccaceae bacterium K14]